MSRLAFRLQSIPAASGSVVRVDTASGSNTPADLRTLDGNAIDGAVIRSGSNGGHLPTVLGPDGVATLYQKTLDYRGQVTGSPVTLTGEDDNPSAPTYGGDAATTNASLLTSGTLSAARLPDLSGTYAPLASIGVTIPRGSLDRWKAARAQAKAGGILGEVVCYGDSTWWGQVTNTTNVTTGDGRYPLPQKLRALAVAAGYPDGGTGIAASTWGTGSFGALDGSSLVLQSSSTGTWAASTGFYGPLRQYGYKNTTNTAGDSLTVQLRVPANGGKLRIVHTVGTPANATAWTYAVDGGSTTTVAAQTATRKIKTREIAGLTAGTHTVVITITTAGAAAGGDEWAFEALGPSGLCFQNYSIVGSKVSNRWDISAGLAQEVYGLGYYEDATWTTPTTPYTVSGVRTGSPRNPVLAMFGLAMNDLQNGATNFANATAANDALALVRAGVGSFAESIRDVCDGVVCLPHLVWGTNNAPYAGAFRAGLREVALASGLAVADMQVPLGGGYANKLLYGSTVGGPHLNQAGYDAQAQYLWDNVLNAA